MARRRRQEESKGWNDVPLAVHELTASLLSKDDRDAVFALRRATAGLRPLVLCADVEIDFDQRDFRFFAQLRRDCRRIHTVTVHNLPSLAFRQIGNPDVNTQVGAFEFFALQAQKIRAKAINAAQPWPVAYLLAHCADVAFDYVLNLPDDATYGLQEQAVLAELRLSGPGPGAHRSDTKFSEISAERLECTYGDAARLEPGSRLVRSVRWLSLSAALPVFVFSTANWNAFPTFSQVNELTARGLPSEALGPFLNHFPAVAVLVLHFTDAPTDAPGPAFPTVATLRLPNADGLEYAPFFSVLLSWFPNLEELSLSHFWRVYESSLQAVLRMQGREVALRFSWR